MLSNPPYGVDWKKYQDPIKEEAAELGDEGRFGAGTPRISDGQLLFLQHMISKMRDDEQGSRIALLNDEKPFQKLSRDEQISILKRLQSLSDALFTNRNKFEKRLAPALKVSAVKISAPLKKAILAALSERDENADICTDKIGNAEADTDLRDHELVPLKENWQEYFKREVTPFVADAWVDEAYTDATDKEIGRVGYEINFNRYFYKYVPPRPLDEIDAELKQLESEIAGLLREVAV